MRRRCPGWRFTTRPRTEEFSCDAGGRVESQDEDDAPAVRVCPRPRRPPSGAHRSRCPRFPARRGRRGRRPRERRACCLLRAWCPIRPRGLAQDASELRPALAPVPPRARSTAVRPPVGGARARPDHPAGAGACRSVLPLTAVASALAPLCAVLLRWPLLPPRPRPLRPRRLPPPGLPRYIGVSVPARCSMLCLAMPGRRAATCAAAVAHAHHPPGSGI